ncbi:sulfate/molybdate ABC transporter ATP-binding protein [Pseudanabaena sp. PCC 6802]|uniref:sulfate/molybdate ABC transporter ATP-binding protein n=1 Tax=Pseudanabaena sp. PCC 6802 TaxID=118173 RepID=UPI0003464AA2|nr:TOBE-like domain-containing protein [Pseudanabaena sp. PCC 6802]
MGILVEDVSKQFGDFQAIDRVSLKVNTGSLVALLGPSGSGKSTLLRLIAGLEIPDRGQIWIASHDATYQPVANRNIGFVFQHYALFKHMTVSENIAFGLDIRKVPRHTVKQKVGELLELVQMKGLGDRYPSQLSGGQRQRIALARALAVAPQILLLDEPFGALDAKVRKELRIWLRQLHHEVNVTTVFVTHDQEEAMEVADEIVVMNNGRIEQSGSPSEIYDNPASPFVMGFIGEVNVLSARGIAHHINVDPDDRVFLRPHDIDVFDEQDELLDGSVPAKVSYVAHLGREIQAEVTLPDRQSVTIKINRDRFDRLRLVPKQQVYIKPRQAKVFPSSLP